MSKKNKKRRKNFNGVDPQPIATCNRVLTSCPPPNPPNPTNLLTEHQEHPEDRIYKDKSFINRLSEVQTNYFDSLSKDLRLTQEGTDLLFDYVYNENSDLSFDEWLSKLGRNYNNLTLRSNE